MGMNIQRENREDTLINQDVPYFLEAIRNGAQGLDHLTNFVDSITISNDLPGSLVTYTNSPNGTPSGPENFNGNMTNGQWIIGLLTTPKYWISGSITNTNRITALVHSLSGAAVEQGTNSKDLSFTYQLTSEIMPFSLFSYGSTNFNDFQTNTFDWIIRSNRWIEELKIAKGLVDTNAALYELRLTARWPVLANGQTGPRRQQFRTLISSRMTNGPYPQLWFIAPQEFVKQE
jgi:hypothetical protein